MKKRYSENERAVLLAKYENSGKYIRCGFAKDEKMSEMTLIINFSFQRSKFFALNLLNIITIPYLLIVLKFQIRQI